MVERIILLFVCLLLAVVFWFLAILVDKWYSIKKSTVDIRGIMKSIENRMNELDKKVNAHSELFSGVATTDDIDREANAMLNIRNDIGKLGNRVQALEKEIKK